MKPNSSKKAAKKVAPSHSQPIDPTVQIVAVAIAALFPEYIREDSLVVCAANVLKNVLQRQIGEPEIRIALRSAQDQGVTVLENKYSRTIRFSGSLRTRAILGAAKIGVLEAIGAELAKSNLSEFRLFTAASRSGYAQAAECERMAIYCVFTGNLDVLLDMERMWLYVSQVRRDQHWHSLAHAILAHPFSAEVMGSLSPEMEDWFTRHWIGPVRAGLPLPMYLEEYLRSRASQQGAPHSTRLCAGWLSFWSGAWDEAQQFVSGISDPNAWIMPAMCAAARGDADEAIAQFDGAMARVSKSTKKFSVLFEEGIVLYVLSLIRRRRADDLFAAEKTLAGLPKKVTSERVAIYALQHLLKHLTGAGGGGIMALPFKLPDPLSRLAYHVDQYTVVSATSSQAFALATAGAVKETEPSRQRWVYANLLAIQQRLQPSVTELAGVVENLRAELGIVQWLCDPVSNRSKWEEQLDTLEALLSAAVAPTETRPTRIAWVLHRFGQTWEVSAVEQKRTAKGDGWTKGMAVALPRLAGIALSAPDSLTHHDKQVCALIRPNPWGSGAVLDGQAAVRALIGHPTVFFGSTNDPPVAVVRGDVSLTVDQTAQGYVIRLVPSFAANDKLVIVLQERRVVVYELDDRIRRAATFLGQGLGVPRAAESRVKSLLPRLAGVATVHAGVDADDADIPVVVGDPRPRALLAARGGGVTLDLRVRPLGEGTPAYHPGQGGQAVLLDVKGQPTMCKRGLIQEIDLARAVVDACPSLGASDPTEVGWSWDLSEPLVALEVLVELGALNDSVVLEWAEGKKLALPTEVSTRSLRVQIGHQSDYFSARPEIVLDDGALIDFDAVISAYRSARRGRFVVVGQDKVLALSEQLRRTLEDLDTLLEKSKTGYRFSPVRALAIQPLLEQADSVKVDSSWKKWLKLLNEAENLAPEVPTAFRDVLRSYQVDGFVWLLRLAHARFGACLADDMGLGKTIQVLAVLTYRAHLGPALVAAPMSVCMNWVDETRRFAPDLRALVFGPGDRTKMVQDAKPGDVIVVSYGLLLSESELFASRKFSTIVLDEAQWIKNMAAKRSHAAMALQGDFRIITTGTPIENHLGELWNLFRFINPGLLGPWGQFSERFAVPIERDGDKSARRKLRTLLGPFILRRTKSQVLEELPSRTEITIQVVPSQEEATFYEALRRRALATMTGLDTDNAGQKHVQMLAELMRLRRACCNPRLVVPEISLKSSKLQTFLDLVSELVEGAHRALVFSQFVDHLALAKEALDELGVSYQYLDGSTSAADRRKGVEAFQRGEGDVFLISLKAGGVGLNLTGADYVIHLDPWWNPAAEDQASDRAHRLGQTRPVTIYRLVMQDTVESRIVDLHRRKRDLAASLLEGTDTAKKLRYEDLVALLQD